MIIRPRHGIRNVRSASGGRMHSAFHLPTGFRAEQGNAVVEIALTLPLVVLIITVIWQLGIVFNQMISLTQATTAAAQVLQADRLSTSNDPCGDTFSAIKAAAPTLTSSKIGITFVFNGNTAITQTSCPGKQTQLVQGGSVSVQTTYPYSISLIGYKLTSLSGTMNSGTISEIEY